MKVIHSYLGNLFFLGDEVIVDKLQATMYGLLKLRTSKYSQKTNIATDPV
jgi:hypothetical protein